MRGWREEPAEGGGEGGWRRRWREEGGQGEGRGRERREGEGEGRGKGQEMSRKEEGGEERGAFIHWPVAEGGILLGSFYVAAERVAKVPFWETRLSGWQKPGLRDRPPRSEPSKGFV